MRCGHWSVDRLIVVCTDKNWIFIVFLPATGIKFDVYVLLRCSIVVNMCVIRLPAQHAVSTHSHDEWWTPPPRHRGLLPADDTSDKHYWNLSLIHWLINVLPINQSIRYASGAKIYTYIDSVQPGKPQATTPNHVFLLSVFFTDQLQTRAFFSSCK